MANSDKVERVKSKVISFSVDRVADRDIIDWLDSLDRGEKSAAICDAIREHIGRRGVTIGDVYQAVKDLERKVQAGAVVINAGGEDHDDEEPPEAAAALDALGNL